MVFTDVTEIFGQSIVRHINKPQFLMASSRFKLTIHVIY